MTRTDWQELDFYVDMRRGQRVAFLAGPFTTLTEAMQHLDAAIMLACEIDLRAHFDLFGTCHLSRDAGNPIGKLNKQIGC